VPLYWLDCGLTLLHLLLLFYTTWLHLLYILYCVLLFCYISCCSLLFHTTWYTTFTGFFFFCCWFHAHAFAHTPHTQFAVGLPFTPTTHVPTHTHVTVTVGSGWDIYVACCISRICCYYSCSTIVVLLFTLRWFYTTLVSSHTWLHQTLFVYTPPSPVSTHLWTFSHPLLFIIRWPCIIRIIVIILLQYTPLWWLDWLCVVYLHCHCSLYVLWIICIDIMCIIIVLLLTLCCIIQIIVVIYYNTLLLLLFCWHYLLLYIHCDIVVVLYCIVVVFVVPIVITTTFCYHIYSSTVFTADTVPIYICGIYLGVALLRLPRLILRWLRFTLITLICLRLMVMLLQPCCCC